MSWIARYVHAGDLVVDVGANCGEVTKALLERGATVLAIEPHRDMVAILRQYYPTVAVLHAAAWSTPGEVVLYHSQDAAQSSLWPANLLIPKGTNEIVPAVTLDEIAVAPVAIKVDAQGAEAAILRGSTRLLRDVRPIWYIEIWRDGLAHAGSSVGEVCDLFDAAGYVAEGQTWAQVRDSAGSQSGHSSIDAVMVPREHAA